MQAEETSRPRRKKAARYTPPLLITCQGKPATLCRSYCQQIPPLFGIPLRKFVNNTFHSLPNPNRPPDNDVMLSLGTFFYFFMGAAYTPQKLRTCPLSPNLVGNKGYNIVAKKIPPVEIVCCKSPSCIFYFHLLFLTRRHNDGQFGRSAVVRRRVPGRRLIDYAQGEGIRFHEAPRQGCDQVA